MVTADFLVFAAFLTGEAAFLAGDFEAAFPLLVVLLAGEGLLAGVSAFLEATLLFLTGVAAFTGDGERLAWVPLVVLFAGLVFVGLEKFVCGGLVANEV